MSARPGQVEVVALSYLPAASAPPRGGREACKRMRGARGSEEQKRWGQDRMHGWRQAFLRMLAEWRGVRTARPNPKGGGGRGSHLRMSLSPDPIRRVMTAWTAWVALFARHGVAAALSRARSLSSIITQGRKCTFFRFQICNPWQSRAEGRGRLPGVKPKGTDKGTGFKRAWKRRISRHRMMTILKSKSMAPSPLFRAPGVMLAASLMCVMFGGALGFIPEFGAVRPAVQLREVCCRSRSPLQRTLAMKEGSGGTGDNEVFTGGEELQIMMMRTRLEEEHLEVNPPIPPALGNDSPHLPCAWSTSKKVLGCTRMENV